MTIVIENMLFILFGIIHALRRPANDDFDDAEIETHKIDLPEELQQQIIEEIEKQIKERK